VRTIAPFLKQENGAIILYSQGKKIVAKTLDKFAHLCYNTNRNKKEINK